MKTKQSLTELGGSMGLFARNSIEGLYRSICPCPAPFKIDNRLLCSESDELEAPYAEQYDLMSATINTLSRFREQPSKKCDGIWRATSSIRAPSRPARRPQQIQISISRAGITSTKEGAITLPLLPRGKILCDNSFAAGHSLDGLP